MDSLKLGSAVFKSRSKGRKKPSSAVRQSVERAPRASANPSHNPDGRLEGWTTRLEGRRWVLWAAGAGEAQLAVTVMIGVNGRENQFARVVLTGLARIVLTSTVLDRSV